MSRPPYPPDAVAWIDVDDGVRVARWAPHTRQWRKLRHRAVQRLASATLDDCTEQTARRILAEYAAALIVDWVGIALPVTAANAHRVVQMVEPLRAEIEGAVANWRDDHPAAAAAPTTMAVTPS